MAYSLYKKIRDKRRENGPAELQENSSPLISSQAQLNTLPHHNAIDASRSTTPNPDGEGKPDGYSEPPQAEKPTSPNKEEKTARRKYRWRVIGGLFFPMLVWSLNKTMIAAALPFIASDFNELAQLNWIVAASDLVSTAFIPSFGQFADIFGRYLTLQASMLFMILGSVLCAAAPVDNFPMLLAGRGIQGLAAAGIMVLTRMVLSDKVSLKENAVNNTVFSLVASIGFGVGPVIGGYLTAVSWRWCFIINIPLSVIGVICTHFLTRPVMLGPQDIPGQEGTTKLSRSASFFMRLQTVDFGGQFLFLFGMGLLVLALTWAGAYYPWASVRVLAPLAIGSVLLIVFLSWEYLLLPGQFLARKFPHQQPMISLELVWTRNAGLLMYINFITGMAMYSAFYFVELYFTIVEKFGSDEAGINLLYYLPGLGAGVYMAMFICNVWPRKTWYPLSSGTVFEALGITLLAAALHWGKLPVIYGMLALAGLGSGIRYMPNTLHAVGYYRQHVATIVSLMSLAISLGSTLASTIMLNIFNNQMSGAGINLAHGAASGSSFSSIDQLPPEEQAYFRQHAKSSIVVAFYGISSFMWLGVVAVLFLGNVNITRRASSESGSGDDQAEEQHSLTKGSYLGSLLRRKNYDGSERA